MSAAAARLQDEEAPYDPREELVICEVIRGEEMMSPRPARRHIKASTRLATLLCSRYDNQLGPPLGGPGGWVLLAEPELHLEGEDPVVPDVAGWREQRAPEEDTDEAAYLTAPDWVCEILSPRTRTWDREKKMPFYAFHRVGHLWMLDPIARSLEVYALGRRGWELLGTHGGEQVVRVEPFEQMDLPLFLLWAARRPRRGAGAFQY